VGVSWLVCECRPLLARLRQRAPHKFSRVGGADAMRRRRGWLATNPDRVTKQLAEA